MAGLDGLNRKMEVIGACFPVLLEYISFLGQEG